MKHSIRCDAIKNFNRDPKQLLIAELTRQDREEGSKIDVIAGRPVDQRMGASDQYIVLDSSQRDTTRSDPSKGVFAFNIVAGGTTGSGMIGVVNQLNDIIEIEMQSFPFPNIPTYTLPQNPISSNSLPVLIPNGGAPTNLNQILNNRFIVQIEETSVQSYSDTDGVRHNFAFDILSSNGQTYANPVGPVYVFTDPITRFDTITLIFRNPPVNLEFGEDTMKGARLAIRQTITLTSATAVSIVIHNKLSDYASYTYTHGAGTLAITVPDADLIFTNPNAGANTFKYKDGVSTTDMTTSTRLLIDNAEDDGKNEANGVYALTTLVDNGGTHTYTFTRTTDMNQIAEVIQYVSVKVLLGTYKAKIYFLNTSISAFTEDQEWLDYGTTYLLSLYYPGNKLIVEDRLKIRDLKQGSIPQKLYNHLTRSEGLYVGTVSTVVPPVGTPPIDDTRNYFRLNPDVVMGEFIYNSFTNNYTIKNVAEAKLYGFDILKSGQIIIVPKSITKGISQLAETITYDKAVDTTTPGAFIYSNWTVPPDSALYGKSTLTDNVEYKTFTSKYNTAAVLDKTIDNHDLRYFELEYTGDEDALTDIYLGIIKPFTTSDFVTILILADPTWTTPGGNTFGSASIAADGSYTTAAAAFDTAAIVNKSISDGTFVVFEYTNALTQLMDGGFSITDELTYEALTGVDANWTLDYQDISANENLMFRLEGTTTFKHSTNGAAIVTDTVTTVADMLQNGKVAIAVATVNDTTINVAVNYIQSDDTLLFSKVFTITVADEDAWYTANKMFYMTSNKATLTLKNIYSDTFPGGLPTAFIATSLQTNTHLRRIWYTPTNYTFGNGSVNATGVYSTKSTHYDTPVILDVPVTSGSYTLFKYTGTPTQMLKLYVGIIDTNAYQSLVINTGLPQSSYDNWSINQKITNNEGFIFNMDTNTVDQVPLLLVDKTPIGLPTGYQNSYANLVDGVYSTTSSSYNTVAVMYTLIDHLNRFSFKYLGTPGTPSAYFGLINKANFTSTLNTYSPLYLTTKADWQTPADFQYGNAEINAAGQYIPEAAEATTAVIVKNDDDIQEMTTQLIYNGSNNRNLSARFGYVDKEAFEAVSKDVNSQVTPFLLTKNLWNLPAAFDGYYKSGSVSGGVYKSNVAKYATAALVNQNIQDSTNLFVYTGSTDKYPKAVFGFISRDTYQALATTAVGDNWANSLEITDGEGILMEILRPEDARNTNGVRQQILVKYNNATTTNHTFNSTKILPKFSKGTALRLGYHPTNGTTIYLYFDIWQDGVKIFSTADDLSGADEIDITVADSAQWHRVTAGLDPDRKNAYITINNKTEKYVSDPTYPLEKWWAVTDRMTYKDGLLIEFMAPTDPNNPFHTNTCMRYVINGKQKTEDLGAAILMNNANKIDLSYVITNATTITVTAVITHNAGSLTRNFAIENIIDSSKWIDNQNVYLVNYVTDEKWSTVNPTDWAKMKALTANNGVLFRVLSPADPSNPHGPNSALAKIVNGVAEAYIDLGSVISIATNAYLTIVVKQTGATTMDAFVQIYSPDNVLQINQNAATLTIADAAEYADWPNTVVPYITTNDSTESYESNISLNGTLLFNNSVIKEAPISPMTIKEMPQNSMVALYIETKAVGEITFQLEYLNSAGVLLYNQNITKTIAVADVGTWYDNKRFYISTNNPTESYQVAYIDTYYLTPTVTPVAVPHRAGDTIVNCIDDLVPVSGSYNWTNSINVSKNEGFLTQFDFAGGTGTSLENGTSVSLTATTALSTSKLDKGGYIQVAIKRSTNDIVYEVVIIRKDNTVIGAYNGTMTTADGALWLAEKTKRLYITTNKTAHTFKSTELPHTYLGVTITPTNEFINVGDAAYKIYTSDFANILPGKRFSVMGKNVTNVNNFIIALTSQELTSLNKLYQLETMDDIKSTGIRLTENNLIMPLASPTIYVPSRVFKIPMRFRRILRRLTQMSGL